VGLEEVLSPSTLKLRTGSFSLLSLGGTAQTLPTLEEDLLYAAQILGTPGAVCLVCQALIE